MLPRCVLYDLAVQGQEYTASLAKDNINSTVDMLVFFGYFLQGAIRITSQNKYLCLKKAIDTLKWVSQAWARVLYDPVCMYDFCV